MLVSYGQRGAWNLFDKPIWVSARNSVKGKAFPPVEVDNNKAFLSYLKSKLF